MEVKTEAMAESGVRGALRTDHINSPRGRAKHNEMLDKHANRMGRNFMAGFKRFEE